MEEEQRWLRRVHSAMTRAIEMFANSERNRAFGDLDLLLTEAISLNHGVWVKILCGHAAVIAHAMGDRTREIKYRQQALQFEKDRQFALYRVAKLLKLDGQIELANQYMTEAYNLALNDETREGRDLAKEILESFPDVRAHSQ